MNKQNNSLMFRDLDQFLPNALSPIYKKLASSHLKRVFTTLQSSTCQISLSGFSRQLTPHCQEGRELDDFTRFVSWASYDLDWSTTHQFPIENYVIQLDDFTQFLYESTKPSPWNFQMNVKWYSHSPVSENTSEDNSPPKLSCKIIFFVCGLIIISLEYILSV